jgi:hypothetical protein
MVMDHDERIFLNAVTLAQAQDLTGRGYKPVLLRMKPVEVEPKVHVLLRDPSNTKELIIVEPDANMSPVMMDMAEFAEWYGMYGTTNSVQVPLIQNELLDMLNTVAADQFRKNSDLGEKS